MVPDGQAITDRVVRNVKYCRCMYGMFGVELLAVKIIVGENHLEKNVLHVIRTCCTFSDQIANILLLYICGTVRGVYNHKLAHVDSRERSWCVMVCRDRSTDVRFCVVELL